MRSVVLLTSFVLFTIALMGCGGGESPKKSAKPAPKAKGTKPAVAKKDNGSKPAVTPEKKGSAEPSSAEPSTGGWGTLRGKFVYDGTAPTPAKLEITKDQEFCGKFSEEITDQTLVVNAENGGITDVVVWLYVGRGDKAPPIAESYQDNAEAEVELDNKGCRFQPHVAVLRTSQTLKVVNSDTVGHNTKVDMFENSPFNLNLPAGDSITQKLEKPERTPATVSCSIHPWMTGKLVILDHPYVAVSDKDGNFEIKDVPTGKWTFQFWQEKSGYVSQVSRGGSEESWERGRVELTINEGDNDLGEIRIAPALFEK